MGKSDSRKLSIPTLNERQRQVAACLNKSMPPIQATGELYGM